MTHFSVLRIVEHLCHACPSCPEHKIDNIIDVSWCRNKNTKQSCALVALPLQSNHPTGHKMSAPPPLEVEGRYGKRYLLNQSRIEAVESCGLPQI